MRALAAVLAALVVAGLPAALAWRSADARAAESTCVLRDEGALPPGVCRTVRPNRSASGVRLVVSSPATSFRAVYALTADQAPAAAAAAAIQHTIDVVDGWFATQTIGAVQPRWVRAADGEPVVTTVQLAQTRAQLEAMPDPFAVIAAGVAAAAPLEAPTEKTLVFLKIGGDYVPCGESNTSTSVVYEARCNIHPSTTAPWPLGASYISAHEVTHNFGAVAPCAPHYEGTGHVGDDPQDLMYYGPRQRDAAHVLLDPGHDDYYGTGRGATCPDIATSAFWTKTSAVDS